MKMKMKLTTEDRAVVDAAERLIKDLLWGRSSILTEQVMEMLPPHKGRCSLEQVTLRTERIIQAALRRIAKH